MLVALCGIDGAGKTTQGKLLYDYYKNQGRNVYLVKQHTPEYYVNKDMNKYLHERSDRTKENLKKLALYSANDRLEQYNSNIQWMLDIGAVVIVDRYVFSSYVYFMARGMDLEWLIQINKELPKPDITICLDVTIEEARRRLSTRNHLTVEEKDFYFLNTIRNYYISQPWGKSEQYFVLNGIGNTEYINKSIIEIIKCYLYQWKN